MDLLLLLDICIQAAVFLTVFLLLSRKDETDRDRQQAILDVYAATVERTSATFMEQIAKVEQKHFEQLDKQTKTLLAGISTVAEAFKPEPAPLIPVPDLLDKVHRENTIEKEELPETFLDEMPRIPMLDGLNVKFEDDEEIFPINIEH